MAAMIFVNFNFGYTILPPFFTHGVVYFSGPDMVMPCFHFCVGFAYRLTTLRRVGDKGRLRAFYDILTTRVVGLILLSMFMTEGWGQWQDWSDFNGVGDWLHQLVSNPQPYHTLLHIAFVAVWTFYAMSLPWYARAGQLVLTIAIHTTLLATFYFKWVQSHFLDEGGYFAFFGWAIPTLIGSFAHDVCMWADAGGGEAAAAAPLVSRRTASLAESLALAGATGYGSVNSRDTASQSLLWATDAPSASSAQEESGSCACLQRKSSRRGWIAVSFVCGAIALTASGYLLSCLGTIIPLTDCFDASPEYRDFFGGFGPAVDCAWLRNGTSSYFITPPFTYPDPAVVTMWSMTQRAGSVTYHLFSSGTSMAFLAILYALCEIGLPRPTWWNSLWGARLLGLHTAPAIDDDGADASDETTHTRLVMRWHLLEVFGENSLAVYLISDSIGNNITAMVPQDSPPWYFLLWGEGVSFVIIYVFAAYLRAHKLFLRL